MSYTLYGDRCSGSSIVEAALAELGEEVRLVDVPLERDAQKNDDYARVNPQRKLPTLITPTGETLTESAAIVLTLAERNPGAGLLPDELTARAQAVRWLLFVATELYPVVEIIDYPERFTAESGDPEGTRERARQIWRTRLALLEDQIAGDPFLLPSGFCATDIYIAVVSRWGRQTDWRPKHVPKMEALTAAVASREAIAPVWARHFGHGAPS